VNTTWAQRCDTMLFMSSKPDRKYGLPVVALNVSEGRSRLYDKTKAAFRYLYEHHLDDGDWFLKADDDTYVIMENLRHFLSDKDPESPVLFGQLYSHVWTRKQSSKPYVSGGAGYVLSKEALRRFGAKGKDVRTCKTRGGVEDYSFSSCLQDLGVIIGNSTDGFGRSRFNSLPLHQLLGMNGPHPAWYIDVAGDAAKLKVRFCVLL
jgi:glycoprotein-N-acetylgalactosamine 3-beta-galactosyltransferase